MGRYNPGKTTDESLYLKAYSGDFSRVDRSKGDPIVLRNPCLTLCWFVQPDLVATMLDEDSLSASGFLPRLLVCRTHAALRRIEGNAPGISDSVRAQWRQLIAAQLATFHAAPKPCHIEPTPEAKRLLDGFHNSIVDRHQTDLAERGHLCRPLCGTGLAHRCRPARRALRRGCGRPPPRTRNRAKRDSCRRMVCAQQLDILAKGRREAAERIETQVLEFLETNRERKRPRHITARDVLRARIVATAEAAHALLARLEGQGLLVGEGRAATARRSRPREFSGTSRTPCRSEGNDMKHITDPH
jgi:hypothetical protein